MQALILMHYNSYENLIRKVINLKVLIVSPIRILVLLIILN